MAGMSRVRLSPPSHNFPLHLADQMMTLPAELVHIHYHWLFSSRERTAGLVQAEAMRRMARRTFDWLEARLPLRSVADG